MRYVPARTFNQGSPGNEPCREINETAFSHVLTRTIAVMETEVTRQMWADLRLVRPVLPPDPTNVSFGGGMTNPTQNMTWKETILFANLLSLQNGLVRYGQRVLCITPARQLFLFCHHNHHSFASRSIALIGPRNTCEINKGRYKRSAVNSFLYLS